MQPYFWNDSTVIPPSYCNENFSPAHFAWVVSALLIIIIVVLIYYTCPGSSQTAVENTHQAARSSESGVGIRP